LSDDARSFIVSEQGARGWNSSAVNTLMGRIPGRKRLDGAQWQVAATDTTVASIDHAWPKHCVKFDDQDAEDAYKYYLLTMDYQAEASEVYAAYKEHKKVPAHSYEVHDKHALSPYQQVALCLSMGSEGYAYFMEQGTGKTPVAVARICNEAALAGRPLRALVVCPSNVRSNWAHEVEKFATRKGKVTVLRG